MNRLLIVSLFFLLVACGGNDAPAATDATTTETAAPTNAIPPPAEVPTPSRPTGCTFLADSMILAIMELDAATPITAQAGQTVSSCYYRIEQPYWAADLVLEIADGSRADAILKEVETAASGEQLKVNGHAALLKNEARILTVAAAPPYEVKLSTLAKGDNPAPKTTEERKAILLKLATALEDSL